VFIPVYRYVKVIKIHQDFPVQSYYYKCTATFLWFTVYITKLMNSVQTQEPPESAEFRQDQIV